MNLKFKSLRHLFLLVGCCLTMVSCRTPKDVAYFQDINETVLPATAMESQIKIRPLDKLSIVIKSKDPALSELFNLTVNARQMGQTANLPTSGVSVRSYTGGFEGLSNYTVTPSGEIDFPVLGMLKVAGMTRDELAAFIKGELMGKGLVNDAVVTVEFLNTGFSVMGEVEHPGRFDINKDRLSILEALSIAGDLSLMGRRDNVMLIREEPDGVHTYRLDLTNLQELTKSPAYYVQQSDVIYVEPNDMRKRQTTNNANNLMSAGFWVSIASVLASISVLIFK